METEQGSGNVPAFRGLAYIVYPNRQLQDSQGLRHPQSWKFEVIAGGSLENEAIAPTFLSGAYDDTLQVDIIAMDANNGRYYIFNADNDGNGAVLGFNISDNTQFVQRLGSDMGVGIAAGLGGNFLAICPDGGVIFTNYDAGDTLVWRKLDPLTLATDSELTADDAFDFPTWYATGSTTDYTGQVDSIMCSNSLVESSIMRLRSVVILGAPLEIDYSSPSYGGMRVVAGGDELGAIRFYVAGFGAGGIDIYKVLWQPGTDPLLNPNPSVSSTLIGNVPISSFAPGATGYSQFAGLIYDPNGALITTVNVTAATTPGAYMLSIDTTDANVTWTEEVAGVFAYDYDLGTSRIANGVMYVAGAGSQNVYGVDSGSGAISTVSLAGSGGLSGGIELLGAFVYDGPTGTMVSWTSAGPYVIFINKPVAGTPYIGDIIADISARVGVAPDQIDVSDFQAGTALPSYRTTVLGYALGRQMAARDAIQPLMQVGMFDAIASVVPSTNAPVYRFQARGKPIAHTLSADDLGAYQFGAQAAVEWTSKRALDTDLPRFIRVHYLAPSRDYDNAEQISPSRTTSSTVNDVSIELGVALTDDQAAKVATITWQDMWATRQSYEIATDGSLGYLEAADPVQVPLLERNEPMLLKSLTSSAQSLIKLELVSYSEDAYTSNAVASPPVGPGSSIFYAADSSLFLIDSPLLRDQDDTDRESDPLYTAATAANGGVWDGANIYESDDGATYAQVAQAPNAASFGTATTVLSASASPFVTDTVNTVTVQMAAGSQAPSGTTTSDLLDGANPAVIIDATGSLEVFQFRDVAVNSDETVTLSYLLRGRRGTDQMTGAHQVGSAVVFLSPTTLEIIDLPLSDIGIQLYWKAIASGASLASASPRTFAAIGRSLMPYAPWNPSAAIYSTGDIAINADRRARIGAAEWIDRETDNLPLAEDSSLFECDIISGGAVLRTLREVQLPIVYAAADVATDFGSAPAQLTVALYQISQQVDRGFAMRATLPVILTAGSPPATSPSWIAPGQPGTPSLSVSTDISVAWTAAAPGTYPIANYRLQRSLSGAGGFATIATQPGLTY
ncbi:MAG: phage tail protein, partial [Mycobacteriales bacterium]